MNDKEDTHSAPKETEVSAEDMQKLKLDDVKQAAVVPSPSAVQPTGSAQQQPSGSGSDRIEIQLRIPDQLMAKQIMDKTIALLQKTAEETTDPAEKVQALECIQLIRRDNPQLVALGKPGF